MRSQFRTASMLTVLLISAACSPAPDEEAAADAAAEQASVPAPPPQITQQQVEQHVNATVPAFQAGDGALAAANFTDDGIFISARGRVDLCQGIQDFWTEALKSGDGKNLKVELLKWSASGDMAYILTRYTGGITAPRVIR